MHHLGWLKLINHYINNGQLSDKPPINWSRISSIYRSSNPGLFKVGCVTLPWPFKAFRSQPLRRRNLGRGEEDQRLLDGPGKGRTGQSGQNLCDAFNLLSRVVG